MHKLIAFACGSGAALAFYQTLRDPQQTVYNSWTNSDNPVRECALWDSNWDFRDPDFGRPLKDDKPQEHNRFNSELEKSISKAARHIILVRHGDYLDVGETDDTRRLTDCGRLQAKYTGKHLHELGIKWDKVIASNMVRDQETAEIILKEIDYDKENMKSCSFLREGLPIPPQPPVGHWKPNASEFFRDGPRIKDAFRRYFHRALPDQEKDTYTLMVCHGNVIRYFICRALQFPPEGWIRININHASITWLTISPTGNVSIKNLNDTGFIPANLLTFG